MTGEGTMARAERIELRAQALLLETVGRVLPGGAIDRAADSLRAALALPPDPAPPGPDRYAEGLEAAARELESRLPLAERSCKWMLSEVIKVIRDLAVPEPAPAYSLATEAARLGIRSPLTAEPAPAATGDKP